jgi:hypothetical protein
MTADHMDARLVIWDVWRLYVREQGEGLVKNKVGFVSLGRGGMYVKRKLQVVVFFWKGDSLGLRTHH